MLRALLYLRFVSAWNWLLTRVRSLRRPKNLIGAAVGCAYIYFFFIHSMGGPAAPRPADEHVAQALARAQAQLPVDWLPAMIALGALGLLFVVACAWLVPTERPALGFTEAEIAFLFPAPIKREALVHFRLLSMQLRSLAGALVMTLFTNRAPILGGNVLTHALGWWLVFSALSLHFSAARFTLTRLAEGGTVLWRQRVLWAALLLVVLGATVLRLPEAMPAAARGAASLRPVVELAVALGETAPLAWLLWPFHIVAAPFLALDLGAFARALGPALALVGLHYLWVVRSVVAFEDTAVDQAAQRAARITAWRRGGRAGGPAQARPGPFPLRAPGRPEVAFFWKNLLSTWPYFTVRVWLAGLAVAVAGAWWIARSEAFAGFASEAALTILIFAGYALVVGPQFARQDIRSDLTHADILKTYPLRGWQIILGQLLTPAAILTGVLWLLLAPAAIMLWPAPETGSMLSAAGHVIAALGLALVMPALVLVQLLVPNAAALLFPAWFQATRARGGGPEVVGQRMIFFFAQLLAMIGALLPAAGLGTAVILALHWIVGVPAAVACAAVAALAVLLIEVWCGVRWLGRRFERFDLSTERPT
ncbi:MAG: hypothetical protein JNL39_16985 [Opitutaceae bacterium]|nr:hypothetical protein [Opitutaceae bacterium]